MDIVHSRESQLLGLNSFKNKNHKVTMGVLKISLEIMDFSLWSTGGPSQLGSNIGEIFQIKIRRTITKFEELVH